MFNLIKPDSLGPNARVLNRVPLTCLPVPAGLGQTHIGIDLRPDLEGPITVAAIVDLETTGLDIRTAEAIELGIVVVGFCQGVLKHVYESLGQLNQPKNPVPEIITQTTGLTDTDLAGHSFNRGEITDTLRHVKFIIAHNAGFDRPFFDRDLFPTSIPWACSSRGGDLNWKVLGYKSSGLENIAHQQGFFYDAHRAVIDCLATAWALHVEPAAATQLFENAFKASAKLQAWGSPFSAKDQLKADGYSWNMDDKVWEKQFLSEADAKAEQERLEREVFRGALRSTSVVIKSPENKYKAE